MTRARIAAFLAGALLASTSAIATEKPRMQEIVIRTIQHSDQRYDTVGDWRERTTLMVPPAPDKQTVRSHLDITVSEMSDERYEFLVGLHELVEAYLCKTRGISEEAVTAFDVEYEAKRKPGDDSEPGDDPRAPYFHEHQVATFVERYVAKELGVDWDAYGKEIASK